MTNPDCHCELAGWCTRHGVQKATRLIELCGQRGEYWDAWEANRGPLQHVPSATVEPQQTAPHNHWCALHYYGVKYRHDWNPTRAIKWYRAWASNIPNTRGCGCREKWTTMDVDIDFSTARKFFDSSVVGHNMVNWSIGKPVISFDQAYAIWWPK